MAYAVASDLIDSKIVSTDSVFIADIDHFNWLEDVSGRVFRKR